MNTITIVRGSENLTLEQRISISTELAQRTGTNVNTHDHGIPWVFLGFVEYTNNPGMSCWYASITEGLGNFSYRYLDVGELHAA